jgi:hypothetical protein
MVRNQGFLFPLQIFAFLNLKNMISTHTKEFCEKIDTNLPGFEKMKIETTRFLQQVPTSKVKIQKDSSSFLLSYLAYSQIWLYLLADDCQFGYITKLKEKDLYIQ